MRFEVFHSPLSKARGLMFSRKRNLVFVFEEEKRRSLHMFCVFFPIDILFLDKDKRIVEIKKGFKPFSFYRSKEKAQFVVELVEDNNYKTGQIFNLPPL